MYKELEAYFENLAKQHVYLNHSDETRRFYRIDFEEYIMKIDRAHYPFLSLERAEFSLSAETNDNISNNRTIAFMLVDKYPGQDNYTRANEIYDEAESVARDIINRILYDMQKGTLPKLLRNLDPNSVNLQHLPMHPVENYCGVRVTFGLQSRWDKTVNNDKWEDL
jgi:hypothetical protein